MQSNQILALLVLGILAFAIWWFIIRTPKSLDEPRSEEWWENHRLKREREDREEEFVSTFGFKPKLMSQDRYKKEVLLKLGLLTKEMKIKGEQATEHPSIFRRDYDSLSEEYSDMLELIGLYDPEFQKDIPHWTELPKFVKEWINGKEFKTSKSSVTVSCSS